MLDFIGYNSYNSRIPCRIALLLPIAACLTPVGSGPALSETLSGPIPATIERVVDGDTLAVRAHIWLGQEIRVLVRIRGIDTPELRGRCDMETRRAERAAERTTDATEAGTVTLFRIAPDKYHGRVLADVTLADGRDLASVLLNTGAARRYDGTARGDWCLG